jgi:hypothetical protein
MASTPTAFQRHIVSVSLADHSLVHLQSMLDHGALQGTHGNKAINSNLRELINGIYHVLAGGTVAVQVTQAGAATIYNSLQQTENDCMVAVNEINAQYAVPVVLEI